MVGLGFQFGAMSFVTGVSRLLGFGFRVQGVGFMQCLGFRSFRLAQDMNACLDEHK